MRLDWRPAFGRIGGFYYSRIAYRYQMVAMDDTLTGLTMIAPQSFVTAYAERAPRPLALTGERDGEPA